MLFLFTFAFISCDKEDEEDTKVTNYQEYELTVASKKVLGMIFSEGNNYFRKVYAVKKNNAQDWISFSSIQDFNYEEGYEYHIKISETTRESIVLWQRCLIILFQSDNVRRQR